MRSRRTFGTLGAASKVRKLDPRDFDGPDERRRVYKPSMLTHAAPENYHTAPSREPTDWYVILCNVNCERRAELGLNQRGFVTYLPMLTKTVRAGLRKIEREVERPLFPRYLFVGAIRPEMPFFLLSRTNGVEAVVRNDGAPLSVPGEIIEEIRRRQRSGEFDLTRGPRTLEEAGLKAGQEMTIICGPFEGITTKIRALLPGKKAEVLLSILGTEKPVKMRLADLKPFA